MGIFFGWARNGRGVAGLLAGALVWVLSVVALVLAMRANYGASILERTHDFGGAAAMTGRLHSVAVGWTLCFTLLQLISLTGIAFALRAAYRLRTAICFIGGTAFVMAGDALGLLCLLVWVGATQGVR